MPVFLFFFLFIFRIKTAIDKDNTSWGIPTALAIIYFIILTGFSVIICYTKKGRFEFSRFYLLLLFSINVTGIISLTVRVSFVYNLVLTMLLWIPIGWNRPFYPIEGENKQPSREFPISYESHQPFTLYMYQRKGWKWVLQVQLEKNGLVNFGESRWEFP